MDFRRGSLIILIRNLDRKKQFVWSCVSVPTRSDDPHSSLLILSTVVNFLGSLYWSRDKRTFHSEDTHLASLPNFNEKTEKSCANVLPPSCTLSTSFEAHSVAGLIAEDQSVAKQEVQFYWGAELIGRINQNRNNAR